MTTKNFIKNGSTLETGGRGGGTNFENESKFCWIQKLPWIYSEKRERNVITQIHIPNKFHFSFVDRFSSKVLKKLGKKKLGVYQGSTSRFVVEVVTDFKLYSLNRYRVKALYRSIP